MPARFCLVAIAAFSVLGCGRLRIARECHELAEIVDGGLRDLERATKPGTPAAYRTAGAQYRKIADQLRATAGSRELRVPAQDHARSIEALGPSVNAYADALESGDAEVIDGARGELERASRREQMASRRLALECQGRF